VGKSYFGGGYIRHRQPWGPVFIADLIKVPRLSIAVNVSIYVVIRRPIIATINLQSLLTSVYYRHVF